MLRKIALLAILLFATSYAYADFTTFEGNDNAYYTSSDTSDYSDAGNYPKITRMEKKIYNRTYESENIYLRLQRLEKSLYHKTYDSVDLADRVDKIAGELQISAMPGYLLTDISALEKANFEKTFSKDSPDNRLDRLEYHLIGAAQEGSFDNRVYKLKQLTTQNGISHYLDSANQDITGLDPVNTSSGKMNSIQNVLYFVAPLLFGLL
ncbi:MAG: hypothetical protein PHE78_00170 [Candidatus Gastranaerophilales bacterium]|nr:hypothetical protein [Candidatus Gastranaerophilales bacterium]